MKCGLTAHEGLQCNHPQRYINCGSEEHSASSNKCPKWKNEKRICELEVTQNISYRQPRETFTSQSKKPSYSAKVQTRSDAQKISVPVQTIPLELAPFTSTVRTSARSDSRSTKQADTIMPATTSRSATMTSRPNQKPCHRPLVTAGPLNESQPLIQRLILKSIMN